MVRDRNVSENRLCLGLISKHLLKCYDFSVICLDVCQWIKHMFLLIRNLWYNRRDTLLQSCVNNSVWVPKGWVTFLSSLKIFRATGWNRGQWKYFSQYYPMLAYILNLLHVRLTILFALDPFAVFSCSTLNYSGTPTEWKPLHLDWP